MTQRARAAFWGFGAGFIAASTASKIGFGRHAIDMTAFDWMGLPMVAVLLALALVKSETN